MTLESSDAKFPCPTSQEPLTLRNYQQQEVYECIHCWLHWLTGAQLARLLQQRGELETFVAKAERALTSNTRRACPQGRPVLLQSTKIDDVTLDYCLRCGGTLFD